MTQPLHQQIIDLLSPALEAYGFGKPVTYRRKNKDSAPCPHGSDVSRVHWNGPDSTGLGLTPSIDVYTTDMYPNEKGEAFMHCFNYIGMAVTGKNLVAFLNKRGIKARATQHKKFKGIRFAFSPDWGFDHD